MTETKKARVRKSLANVFPEIQEIDDEIIRLKKERNRLTQKISKARNKSNDSLRQLSRWAVPRGYLKRSFTESKIPKAKTAQLFDERLLINDQIQRLEGKAQEIHKKVNDLIWLSDNPNIQALRKDLLVIAKMVGDFNG